MSTIILASFATSFIVCFFFIPVIIKIFQKKKILDAPGRRKIHKEETPSMGGIAIFLGLFVSVLIWMPAEGFGKYKFLYAAFIIIFLTGIRDDLIPLKPLYKLAAQLIAAFMVISLADIKLNSLYGLLGIYQLPEYLCYLISLITIIVITNSFNLIDGLDGLAGTIALIALTAFGIWFFMVAEYLISILVFSLAGGIIAFLNFNWEPSKIFMGDTGALLIGFLLSVLAIYFIDFNYNLEATNSYKFQSSITMAVCILVIPLFDTLRVFISRAIKKQSPFAPDKAHIHHLLMRLGLSHSGSVMVLAGVNVLFILIGLVGKRLNDNLLLAIVIGLLMVLSLILDFLIAKKFPKAKRQKENGKLNPAEVEF